MFNICDIYLAWWRWWAETFIEVKALRNCRNEDRKLIDRHERALREMGV
jgi:hypothetical protein